MRAIHLIVVSSYLAYTRGFQLFSAHGLLN